MEATKWPFSLASLELINSSPSDSSDHWDQVGVKKISNSILPVIFLLIDPSKKLLRVNDKLLWLESISIV